MTLVDRVSVFFLAALAVILCGYSAVVVVSVRSHLSQQFDQRLHSALHVLTAAIEVEDDDVKWQPSDHTIDLGDDPDEVRWALFSGQGKLVDASRNLDEQSLGELPILTAAQTQLDELSDEPPFETETLGEWRMLKTHLEAPHPKAADSREPDEFNSLTVVVALSQRQMQADVWWLALLVSSLSAALWLIAAVGGRRFCRRALAPVRQMSAQARPLQQVGFGLRLPVPERRDELAELAVSFNSLLDELQGMFERQQRFTSEAAHQLRTPLTVLRGQVDVALRRPRSEEEYRTVLETLRGQTEELQQIVEALLFLARADEDGSPPDLTHLPLKPWLTGYVQRWTGHPRFTDLQVELPADPTVVASPALLVQLLDVLLQNAFKYSTGGSCVRLELEEQPGAAVLAVTDQGLGEQTPGIPPDEREAIFRPFYRSQQARQSGIAGTGLGLAIAARIAQTLGGTIQYQPAGPGSRFVVTLPLAEKPTTS